MPPAPPLTLTRLMLRDFRSYPALTLGLGGGVAEAVRRMKASRQEMPIEIEAQSFDQVDAAVAAAVAAGGRILNDAHAPMWWTLADPEGNEADVATWLGRN